MSTPRSSDGSLKAADTEASAGPQETETGPARRRTGTVSMYDMGAANRDGLHKSVALEQRKAFIAQAAAQRHIDFTGVRSSTPEALYS
jgi:hypothetical protein